MRSQELLVPQTADSKAYSNQPTVADNDSFLYKYNFPLFLTILVHSADTILWPFGYFIIFG